MNDDDEGDVTSLAAMHSWYTQLLAVVGVLLVHTPLSRNPTANRQKLLWEEYVLRFSNNPTFIKRHLRMSLDSFYKLLSYIREGLEVDNVKAKNRGGAIMPELCLFCTLRWLAGGSYLDIFVLTGVSIPSFYRVVYRTLRLIVACKELEICLPATEEECKVLANGFRGISFKEAITNCIGVIDGYLLRIYTPPKAQAGNVKSYFSGHYQCYGINIQAICDHNSRFLYFAIAAPGSVNDREAVKEAGILTALSALPELFVIIGDAAYEPSERLVPMFFGVNRQDASCDNFNFYASQCRIHIEMAFGLMQMKWGILWRPMRVKLDNIKYIILAIARLHNFTINERLAREEPLEEVATGANRIYNPSDPIDDDDEDENDGVQAAKDKRLSGLCLIRDRMVERIVELQLVRPAANIIKNKDNEEDELSSH